MHCRIVHERADGRSLTAGGARNRFGGVQFDQHGPGREHTNLQQRSSMSSRFFASKLYPTLLQHICPPVTLGLMLAVMPAQAHWPNQNLTKWLQPPDPTNGIDVLVGQLTTSCQPIILADDFQCRRPGPISDIHIWTSWTNNQPSWNLPITLCIWSDVKAVTNAVGKFPSHPGTILWCQTFYPGQYTVEPWRTAYELFWSPNPQCPLFASDKMIWLYNFYPNAANQFFQQGSHTSPVTYWLSMSV